MVTGFLWEDLTRSRGPDGESALGALVLIALCLNLYFLVFRAVKGNDWLSLWMKRKKLEEEKRIKDLEEQTQN
jgi:hypothetical protein